MIANKLLRMTMFRIVPLLLVMCLPALARDNGQYNNVSPEIRQWFQDQKSPKAGGLCCSEADGNEAQEDNPERPILDHNGGPSLRSGIRYPTKW
jgi:hypothetical protein